MTTLRHLAQKRWDQMIQRCHNPNHPRYADYGGRGITVCTRWQSFEIFYEDTGDPPSASHSLDRFPDNNKGYEPGNWRWSTVAEQNRNRRNVHRITFAGRTQSATEWAAEFGLNPRTVKWRAKQGWPAARVLSKPYENCS